MTILMLCWEFPPFIAGGLGMACYGIVKALLRLNITIFLFLPANFPLYFKLTLPEDADNLEPSFFLRKDEDNFKMRNFKSYAERLQYLGLNPGPETYLYNDAVFQRVRGLRETVSRYGEKLEFDIIHAHDWLTYPAAGFLKQKMRKPLVVHVHSTEYDRSCGPGNEIIHRIERMGLLMSDAVIAVSNYTKSVIREKYGIEAEKIKTVYNSYTLPEIPAEEKRTSKEPVILFLGRLTRQKGPEYFLETAKKIHELCPEASFIMAGEGDYKGELIRKSAEYGMEDKFIFTGFLNRKEVAEILNSSDILILPSVSEPFGITVLEAMRSGVVVIASGRSGVSEFMNNIYKTDFNDIDRMSSLACRLIRNPQERKKTAEKAGREVEKTSWDTISRSIIKIYLDIHENL
ncbi:MAG: glycosyltransferase family 4 protein [Spirochaetes bacterium]|nr:glycosyltransferase family 4 protein [Spirochaetota bacterium]